MSHLLSKLDAALTDLVVFQAAMVALVVMVILSLPKART